MLFFLITGHHLDLHVQTLTFPPRRSSDLLANHGVVAGFLEDDAGRAAGDDAGTGGRGLEHDATSAELAHRRVDDGVAGEGDLEEVLSGYWNCTSLNSSN